jgi:hypothetical protein
MKLTAFLTSPVVKSLLLYKVMYSYVCCGSQSFKRPEVGTASLHTTRVNLCSAL